MWRRKRFVFVALLAAVVLVGGIGGMVFAQTENSDESQPKTLLARVAEKLEINQQELEDAFAQARSEMRSTALDNRLQRAFGQDKLTQEEADQYQEWWQARPDMEPFRQQLSEWQQARPGIPPELEEWQQARPDVPIRFGFQGHRGGFRSRGGFGGPFSPTD